MTAKREDYLFLSATLRARETRMLSRDKAERLLDAPSFAESAKLLTDCGYEDMSQLNAAQIDASLSQRRAEIFRELERQLPDRTLLDLFRLRYDYHNAKALLKAEAMGLDPAPILSGAGRVAPGKLLEAYREERANELPERLAAALAGGKELLARTGNPQLLDFSLDRACFEELGELAGASGCAFLRGYVAVLADSTNLRSAVRTLRMGKNADFLRDALVPGGRVDAGRFPGVGAEGLASLFAGSPLAEAASLGAAAVEGGGMTAFELACDNAVMRYLKSAKLTSFGVEPVAAYLAAVETEITAVRMILTGKLAGIAPQTIRERLRDLYA
ncbi:MAG: V-type ATPase subunit [Oscillospiraceae bacterium]|nr:V-type ATPase subunit [Oscillospiraceae bacterium]